MVHKIFFLNKIQAFVIFMVPVTNDDPIPAIQGDAVNGIGTCKVAVSRIVTKIVSILKMPRFKYSKTADTIILKATRDQISNGTPGRRSKKDQPRSASGPSDRPLGTSRFFCQLGFV